MRMRMRRRRRRKRSHELDTIITIAEIILKVILADQSLRVSYPNTAKVANKIKVTNSMNFECLINNLNV